MKIRILSLLLFLFTLNSVVYSQDTGEDCSQALPFCTGIDYDFPASTDTEAEIGPNYGCLGGQPNPVWYYLLIDDSGPIDIHMNSCPNSFDIDFICWGPFPEVTCDYSELSAANTIDCSFSGLSEEDCNIPAANTGDYYMLLITNYSDFETNICFSQSNIDDPGAGSTDCSIVQICSITQLLANPTACNTTNNTYALAGSVTFENPPLSGVLVVEDEETGEQQIFDAPFTSPLDYTITGLLSDGITHNVNAFFSAIETCVNQTTYVAPEPCVTCDAYANETDVCQSYIDLFVNGAFGEGGWTAETLGGAPIADVIYLDPNNPDNPHPETAEEVRAFIVLTEASETIRFVWTQTYGPLSCSDDVVITFNAGPGAEGGNELYVADGCENYSFTLEANDPASGIGWWSTFEAGVTFSDTLDNNATVSVSENFFLGNYVDTLEIQWIVQNAGCTSTDIVKVVFFQKPTAFAGLDTFACGRDFTFMPELSLDSMKGKWNLLSGVSASQLSWNPSEPTDPNTIVSYTGTFTEPQVVEFEWIEKHPINETCLDRDTVSVTFYNVPFIDAGFQNAFCDTIGNLEAFGSLGNGSWNTAGQGSYLYDDINSPVTGIINHSGPGKRLFYWRETVETDFSANCIAQDSVLIQFARTPDLLYNSEYIDTNLICGNACELKVYSTNAEYSGWEDISHAGTDFVNISSTTDNAYVNLYGIHEFVFTAENISVYNIVQSDADTLHCPVADTLIFQFFEIPTPYAGPDDTACVTGLDYYYPLQGIQDLETSGTVVSWNCLAPQFSFLSTGSNNSNILTDSVRPNVMGEWRDIIMIERYGNAEASCPVQDIVRIFFTNIPEADLVHDEFFCFGDTILVKELYDVYLDYNWEFSGEYINVDSTINNNGGYGTQYVAWVDDSMHHEVYVNVQDNYKCWSFADTLHIYEPDSLYGFYTDLIASPCGRPEGQINISAMGGYDTTSVKLLTWLSDTGIVTTYPDTSLIFIQELPSAVYNVLIQDDKCTRTLHIPIDTVGMIDAGFDTTWVFSFIEDGYNHGIIGDATASVFIADSTIIDGDVGQYQWYLINDETLDTLETFTTSDGLTYTFEEGGEFTISLQVTGRNLGCYGEYSFSSLKIKGESILEVPNVFTPNGDGKNDYFQVHAESLKEFHGTIVNRWGKTLYEWNNGEDPNAGWDGKINGNNYASPGVYYYIITGVGMDSDKPYEFKGFFHLFREK